MCIRDSADAPSLFDSKNIEGPEISEKPKVEEGNRKLRRMQAKANRKKRR